jgi:hypothetical protein
MLGDAPVAVVRPAADLARATAFYIDTRGPKVMQEAAESTLLGGRRGHDGFHVPVLRHVTMDRLASPRRRPLGVLGVDELRMPGMMAEVCHPHRQPKAA